MACIGEQELPSATFNRTSMESKHVHRRAVETDKLAFNRTSMESKPDEMCLLALRYELLIEPVWNRNLLSTHSCVQSHLSTFNRTSMESKHGIRLFPPFGTIPF